MEETRSIVCIEVAIMVSRFVPIDGYEWDISEEPETFTRQQREDACDRALCWKRRANPELADYLQLDFALTSQPRLDKRGWLHVGFLVERGAQTLGIHWHPESDRVRVERPTLLPSARQEAPKPEVPPGPLRYTATIKTSTTQTSVLVRFRPYPSKGREQLPERIISLTVPAPRDEGQMRWDWVMRLAENRLNVIEVPDEILTVTAQERRRIFIGAIHDLARKIDAMPKGHR